MATNEKLLTEYGLRIIILNPREVLAGSAGRQCHHAYGDNCAMKVVPGAYMNGWFQPKD